MKQGVIPGDNPARFAAVSAHYAAGYQPALVNYMLDHNFSTAHCLAILGHIVNCHFGLPPGRLATVAAPAAPPPAAPARAVPAPALPTESQTAQTLAEGVLAAYRLNAGAPAPALTKPAKIPQHAPQADTSQTAQSLAADVLAAYRESLKQEGQTQ